MAAGSTINHHLPFEPIESPLSVALLELHFEMKAYNSIAPTKRHIALLELNFEMKDYL